MKELNLPLDGTGIQIGIVACRFNDAITNQLLEGTFARLEKLGVSDDNIDLVWVAGAFEAPLAAKFFVDSKHPDYGTLRLPGVPYDISNMELNLISSPAPVLGEHNSELLGSY